MALIRLTQVPHPDLADGKPQPCYVDASRILLITRGTIAHPKKASNQDRRAWLERLWQGSRKLSDMTNDYLPAMDDPAAVSWMVNARDTAAQVRAAYDATGKAYDKGDYWPEQECTEISMACGTALEHGVMLSRVWVSETPEEVAALLSRPLPALLPDFP